jgi:hypothetical protein
MLPGVNDDPVFVIQTEEEHVAFLYPDAQANARLIAAAPELLAACRDLLNGFWDMSPLEYAMSRNLRDADGMVCMSDEEGERIKSRARAAIAKATEARAGSVAGA